MLSKAEVASSRTIILGFRRRILASAILCRSPPEREAPRSPTFVANLSGSFEIKSRASVSFAASKISFAETS